MNIEMLKEVIERLREDCNRYEEFMEHAARPLMHALGKTTEHSHLLFFNRGFKYALDQILDTIKESE